MGARLGESETAEAILAVLGTRPVVTAGYVAGVLDARLRSVYPILEGLAEGGTVERVQLPTGHVGYRLSESQAESGAAGRLGETEVLDEDEAGSEPPDDKSIRMPLSPLHGLDDIAAFLREGGIAASITSDGRLRTDSTVEKPPAAAMRDPEGCRNWLDSLVASYFGEELAQAVRAHVNIGADLRVVLDQGDAFIFDRRAQRVAVFTATRAHLESSEPVDGNFLADGPQWDDVNLALGHIEHAHLHEPVASEGLHRNFPDGSDPSLEVLARESSRRLRYDRTRVFEHDVRVDIGEVTIVFSPLTVGARPLEVPFAFVRADGERFDGAIQLTLTDALLRCVWHQASDPETLMHAWSAALSAYAELSCTAADVSSTRRSSGAATGASGSRSRQSTRPRGDRRRPRSLAPKQRDPASLPAGFRPLGPTSRYLASYVAGHRRRLQAGHQHSPEAAANAAAVGINLASHETWVQPHTRGMPNDAVLHFAWNAPDWIRRLAM